MSSETVPVAFRFLRPNSVRDAFRTTFYDTVIKAGLVSAGIRTNQILIAFQEAQMSEMRSRKVTYIYMRKGQRKSERSEVEEIKKIEYK